MGKLDFSLQDIIHRTDKLTKNLDKYMFSTSDRNEEILNQTHADYNHMLTEVSIAFFPEENLQKII